MKIENLFDDIFLKIEVLNDIRYGLYKRDSNKHKLEDSSQSSLSNKREQPSKQRETIYDSLVRKWKKNVIENLKIIDTKEGYFLLKENLLFLNDNNPNHLVQNLREEWFRKNKLKPSDKKLDFINSFYDRLSERLEISFKELKEFIENLCSDFEAGKLGNPIQDKPKEPTFEEIFKDPDSASKLINILKNHPEKIINDNLTWKGYFETKTEVKALYQALTDKGKLVNKWSLNVYGNNNRLADLFIDKFSVNVSSRALNEPADKKQLIFYTKIVSTL